jgi:enoyl-CoA hydratase/carnithine racemase
MPAAEPILLIDDTDRVRTCTFNRPERRNAFNQPLWLALTEALRDAAVNDDIGCVVLTGAPGAFTAGQDLSEMADPSVFESQEPGYRHLMPVVEAFPKPLIAAVNGVGVGIGMTILLHCDLVVMAASARVKAPFISLGVTTEASASVLLPATVGWQEAAHLLFTEPWVDATEAVRLGLAWRAVPDDELVTTVRELAAPIAALPLPSLTTTKSLLLEGRRDAVAAARAREDAAFERLVGAMVDPSAMGSFRSS